MDDRVSVFVCGVQKAGTTSLFAHMREHVELAAPAQKELHFFDDETRNWSEPDYGELHASFPNNDGRLRFEATPIYAFWPPALERIRVYNPSAKLIFLFRDPFDRAWSHWCMEYGRGAESLPFAEAIRRGRRRLVDAPRLGAEWRIYSYVERGLYGEQVRRALDLFPREQLLFLRSTELLHQHHAALAKIATFLGITPFPDGPVKIEFERQNVDLPSEPTDADRALVAEVVADDVRRFSWLTGLDVSDWPTLAETNA